MKISNYLFYDTCSLLLNANHLFDNPEERVVISSITLQELEEIKSSNRKDEELKQSARRILRILERHTGEYDIHPYTPIMGTPLEVKGFAIIMQIAYFHILHIFRQIVGCCQFIVAHT